MKKNTTALNWPIFTRSEPTHHIGDLKTPNKPVRFSLEGSGLSVSDHPEEWSIIARLGGGKTYTLAKDNARFIDFTILTRDKDLMPVVREWAVNKGLITPATLYRVSYYDDDLDSEVSTLYASLDEADGEFEEGYDIIPEDGFVATELLARIQRQPKIDPLCVDDMAALAFAQYELKLDGGWWFEELDVMAYSAPRGVIFDPADNWHIKCVSDPEEKVNLVTNHGFDI